MALFPKMPKVSLPKPDQAKTTAKVDPETCPHPRTDVELHGVRTVVRRWCTVCGKELKP